MTKKSIHIENWHEPVPINKETLLDAGLAAGVPIPNQCRSGECGSCKCQLISGELHSMGHLPDALSKSEEEENWVLACRSKAKKSVRVRFAKPLGIPVIQPSRHEAKVHSVTPLTHDVIQLTVQTSSPLFFHAGQYFDLELKGLPVRSYSPASSPGENRIDFFIKILDDGLVSPAIALKLEKGSVISLNGPFGSAYLTKVPDKPVILAAGGTGLSPISSIARFLSNHAPQTQCDLYFGVRTTRDIFALHAFENLTKKMPKLRIFQVLSHENNHNFRKGFLDTAIAEDHQTLAKYLAFIAGPAAMVNSIEERVHRLGIEPDNVFADRFIPAASPASPLAFLKNIFTSKPGKNRSGRSEPV